MKLSSCQSYKACSETAHDANGNPVAPCFTDYNSDTSSNYYDYDTSFNYNDYDCK